MRNRECNKDVHHNRREFCWLHIRLLCASNEDKEKVTVNWRRAERRIALRDSHDGFFFCVLEAHLPLAYSTEENIFLPRCTISRQGQFICFEAAIYMRAGAMGYRTMWSTSCELTPDSTVLDIASATVVRLHSKKLNFATGLRNELPNIPGFKRALGCDCDSLPLLPWLWGCAINLLVVNRKQCVIGSSRKIPDWGRTTYFTQG